MPTPPALPPHNPARPSSYSEERQSAGDGKSPRVDSPATAPQHAILGNLPRRIVASENGDARAQAGEDTRPTSARLELPNGLLTGKVLPSPQRADEIFAELIPLITSDSYSPTSENLDDLRWIAASLNQSQVMEVVDGAFGDFWDVVIGDKACWLGAIAGALPNDAAQAVAGRIDSIQINYLNDTDPEKKRGRSYFLAACLNAMPEVPERTFDIFADKAFDKKYHLMIALVGQPGSKRGGLRDAFGNLTTAQCDSLCYRVLEREINSLEHDYTLQMYLVQQHLSPSARNAVWEKASMTYHALLAGDDKSAAEFMRFDFDPRNEYSQEIIFKDIPQERERWAALFGRSDGQGAPR